jgi:hypothetical protein
MIIVSRICDLYHSQRVTSLLENWDFPCFREVCWDTFRKSTATVCSSEGCQHSGFTWAKLHTARFYVDELLSENDDHEWGFH